MQYVDFLAIPWCSDCTYFVMFYSYFKIKDLCEKICNRKDYKVHRKQHIVNVEEVLTFVSVLQISYELGTNLKHPKSLVVSFCLHFAGLQFCKRKWTHSVVNTSYVCLKSLTRQKVEEKWWVCYGCRISSSSAIVNLDNFLCCFGNGCKSLVLCIWFS